MSKLKPRLAWQDALLRFPLPGYSSKPRQVGYTMVLDKRLGLNETFDLLELAGDYIDTIKLTFGTSALYPESILREKIKLIRSYGVDVYPGGTLLEIALWQDKLEPFLQCAADLGFTGIEVSDGTLSLSPKARRGAIQKAKAHGFKVVTEVGKKTGPPLPVLRMQQMIADDLASGADKVIIEGRESGKGVGIFDETGKIKTAEMEALVHDLSDFETVLIWEAPLKSQQVSLIKRFGPNVNLGNIAPEEVLALAALRCGLRGDTFGLCLEEQAVVDCRVSGKGVE